ncbi:MAG TPA: hypothetical protein VIH61_04770 [Waddliaceae bacterium]
MIALLINWLSVVLEEVSLSFQEEIPFLILDLQKKKQDVDFAPLFLNRTTGYRHMASAITPSPSRSGSTSSTVMTNDHQTTTPSSEKDSISEQPSPDRSTDIPKKQEDAAEAGKISSPAARQTPRKDCCCDLL